MDCTSGVAFQIDDPLIQLYDADASFSTTSRVLAAGGC